MFSPHKERINTSVSLTVFSLPFSLRCRVTSGRSVRVTCTCAPCAATAAGEKKAADSAAISPHGKNLPHMPHICEEFCHVILIYHGFKQITTNGPFIKSFSTVLFVIYNILNTFLIDLHLQSSLYLLSIFSYLTFISSKICKFVSKIKSDVTLM